MKAFTPTPTADTGPIEKIIQGIKLSLQSLRDAVTNEFIVGPTFFPDGVPTKVYHGLSVAPKTWEAVNQTSTGVVYEDPGINKLRSLYVVLIADGNVTASIRFTK